MAKNFNKWIFEGNLLRDPEMRFTPNGHKVTTLMVACNNVHSIGEGESTQKVEEIVIYKATAWNTLAEISNQYLKKGSHVLIEGQPTAEQKLDKTRNGRPKIWTGQDGQPHADHECKVLELRMLGGSHKTDDLPDAPARNGEGEVAPTADDQEFPF